jgi:hypothetical protein
MREVFPSVFIVEEPSEGFVTGNSLVVGTARPSSLADWRANVASVRHPLLVEMARRAIPTTREAAPSADTVVFTDDHAPVERLVHSIVLRYLLGP